MTRRRKPHNSNPKPQGEAPAPKVVPPPRRPNSYEIDSTLLPSQSPRRKLLTRMASALRTYFLPLLVAYALGLASTVTWEYFLKGNTDTLVTLRNQAVELKTELQRHTTIRYLLQYNPNFKNDENDLGCMSPFGLDLPNAEANILDEKLVILHNDIVRATGQTSREATAIEEVKNIIVKGAVKTITYGTPAFVREINSAQSESDEATIFERHIAKEKAAAILGKSSPMEPMVVIPGDRSYPMPETVSIFRNIDSVVDELNTKIFGQRGE